MVLSHRGIVAAKRRHPGLHDQLLWRPPFPSQGAKAERGVYPPLQRGGAVKIVLYDDYKVGLLKDGNVVDVSVVVPRGGTPQLTIEGLITNFQSLKGGLQRALDQGEGIPLSSVQLRAPVPRPGKIVCMGGNFG